MNPEKKSRPGLVFILIVLLVLCGMGWSVFRMRAGLGGEIPTEELGGTVAVEMPEVEEVLLEPTSTPTPAGPTPTPHPGGSEYRGQGISFPRPVSSPPIPK